MDYSSKLDLLIKSTDDKFDHAAQFNNALLELPIFKCKRCKHFLKAPIIFVPNIGNVCESCLIPTESFVVRNTELEQLLESFTLSCYFNNNGCGVKLHYSKIFQHQAECYFRDHCCPLRDFQKCSWKGPLESLCEHVTIHESVIETIDDNSFKISIDPDLEVEVLKFIVMKKNNFIFHAKCNEDRTKLHYKIYYLRHTDLNSFLYVVKPKQAHCATKNSEFFHKSNKIENVYGEQFFDEFDYDNTFYVDLQIFSKEEIEISIETTGNSTENVISETALKALECVVCKNYMVAQIYQCSIGHSVCSDCKPKMHGECPTCRDTLQDTRNYSLETLSENLLFPCLYQEQGCQSYNAPSNYKLHFEQCFYKLQRCPFFDADCGWEGLESSLIHHLQDDHEQKIFVSNFEIISQEFIDSNPVFCMVAFDKVFKVASNTEAEEWLFELFSRSQLEFLFGVGLIHNKNAQGLLEQQYYCRISIEKNE